MWKQIGFGLALLFLCGCFKTKDELTLNADGSGKVRIETRTSLPPEWSGEVGMGERLGGGVMYPPLSEAEAQKFFPAKDFHLNVSAEKADDGDTTIVVEAEFKDINALLGSPYGRAHQLLVRIEAGTLAIKAVSGMEGVARLAEMQDDGGMEMAAMPGVADMQKKKGEMRSEFRVTLPNPISAANGTRDGKTAVWIVERAKCKDAADFACQLGAVSEARCPADGVNMAPRTPARLGLLPFAELLAGTAPSNGSAVDTTKIAAAAKFVPYGLLITRSVDISGGGGAQASVGQLIGAVVLPREYAPEKWGDARLDEVTDGKGNELKSGESARENALSMLARFSLSETEQGEGQESGNPAELRHVVALCFRPPDWKVNEIARIKGSVALRYFGDGSQVVKLTNAVPVGGIMDASKGMGGGGFNAAEKILASPALTKLGLTLSLQMGVVEGGMTMLMLQTGGEQATLTDAQVFDAEGKPWPTFLNQVERGEEGSCQIMIAGKPQPPLSLALLVAGGGSTVEVPVELDHIGILTQ